MNAETIHKQDCYLSLNEAAEYSKLSKVFLYLKRKSGDLPAYKLGKKVLIRRSDLDNFINAKREVCHE